MAGATDNGTGTPMTPSLNGESAMEVLVYGIFDSGSVVIEQTPDGGTTWLPISGTFSANGREEVFIYNPGAIRANLSGVAAAAADITVKAFGDPATVATVSAS